MCTGHCTVQCPVHRQPHASNLFSCALSGGSPDSYCALSGVHRTGTVDCPVHPYSVFKKPVMGTLDTLQCIFGAHRTTHNRKGICARTAGAPDSAQCSVRCAPDCPVSPDRENFEYFYLILNQTKSQLISTQKNTCWHMYWYPHIFSHIFQNILP